MIAEDYVSFETAKLLKEKGFDVPCIVWYAEYTSQYGGDTYNIIQYDNHNRFEEGYKFLFYAPTLQMAMKWLREVHKLYMYTAFAGMEEVWFSRIYNKDKHLKDLDGFNTYEQACEEAIKYCLENLI
jgi:hypothetical protein